MSVMENVKEITLPKGENTFRKQCIRIIHWKDTTCWYNMGARKDSIGLD